MDEKKKESKTPDIFDILNLRIMGIDFSELIKQWTGVADIRSLIERPEELEQIKKKIEGDRAKLWAIQEQLKTKYGDAVRFDYDIRIGGLMGGQEGVRIGGGKFFQNLDELKRERAEWKAPGREVPGRRMTAPKEEGVREPLVDIFEREDHLYITAELPGVEEEDIELSVIDDKVTISANRTNRKYYGELTLPAKVSPSPIERTWKNGVLEAKFKKNESTSIQ